MGKLKTPLRFAIGLLVGVFVAAFAAGDLRSSTAPGLAFETQLLVSTRTQLEVCVDTAPGFEASREVAANSVRTQLAAISREPRFAQVGYRTGWRVVAGCPVPGALLVSGKAHFKAGGPWQVFRTTTPSPYRSYVYVVSPVEIARMFGAARFPIATQEHFCTDQCFAVSTALYVTPDQLGSQFLTTGLRKAIGMEKIKPDVQQPPGRK